MILRIVILLLISINTVTAQAAVTMNGTRVIYRENAKEKTVQLTNTANIPFIIQSWIDDGNIHAEPGSEELNNIPFVLFPAIVRLPEKSGQSLRIVYTGDNLPDDRESIFYLNMMQIPANMAEHADKNSLHIYIKSRFKLFYRPKNIKHHPNQLYESLNFRLIETPKGSAVNVSNKSPFYASFSKALITSNNQSWALEHEMLAPYSEATWAFKENNPSIQSGMLDAALINDYGATVPIKKEITR